MTLAVLLLALHGCHPGALPDRRCTPGRADTQDLQVICHTSTALRRHVTRRTELGILAAYGIPLAQKNRYKIDHLIPLEMGGSNDPANLWPQLVAESLRKDLSERLAHELVCRHHASVAELQQRFTEDWTRVR
jgi:hypothetical protein